ncbi:hypothetical protein GALMADRAFT_106528 [Galerina marginata CBS 339.88]|uniref:Phytanoyl-CoA dioxygenase n=1 Tax=Galerina marginata (strain CBS 339.88) TaxID=685588 RepID=A0A067S904_GALM3|nr:hypothetical protein GALMADRAFT_106528 [Galerina marginata CBS 339.88]
MPLTHDQRDHFLEHGWVKVPNAISKAIIEEWTKNIWVRLGYDENDKSTWLEEYLKLPRHREIPVEELAPGAWEAMCEIVGGEDKIDPVRERYHGDQFIINFGSDYWETATPPPQELRGWHHDNDWYRQFLDSSGNALTIVHCFTDIPPRGGGTWLAEDGIASIVKYLYDHPEGLDPPLEKVLHTHTKDCKKFVQVEAKAGDTLILHGLLPHTNGVNHLHYARVITNPHVNMVEPFNLNRSDGNYTLCEQVILRALGRESVPEYKPTRERKRYHPRTAPFKRVRVEPELKRMLEYAKAHGLPQDSVDSVYLRGEEEIRLHEQRNGYDQPHGPGPIAYSNKDYFFTREEGITTQD